MTQQRSDDEALVAISTVEPRSVVKVCGTIVAVRIEGSRVNPSMTARLDDSTGRLDAVFMGRRDVPGIEPGRVLAVEGRVLEQRGLPVIFNPRYELRCPH